MNRMKSVKRIFSFSSGIRNSVATGLLISAELLDATPRALDLLSRRLAERVRGNGELPRDLSGPEHLHRAVRVTDQAPLRQHLGGDLRIVQLLQLLNVHHLVLHPVQVVETALRETALERHLPTLIAGLAAARPVVASPSFRALVAIPRRLARPRTDPTTDPLPVPV